ncbi:MAG: nuclear transport factor 2 family protein [Calditrichaceae bacterium]
MPNGDKAKASIMEKINMAAEKWSKGDPLGYVECAADDITWMDDLDAQLPVIGKVALKSYLEGFKGKVPPHEKELSDFVFNFYDDIVIITYRYTGTFDGVPADPWKVTSVYRYINGEWLSVHENWTEVK